MPDTLQDLLVEELKDLYDAEHQIMEALPKMAKACSAPDLKMAFETHLEETRNQVTRLEQVFQQFGCKADRKTCHGVKGLIAEANELIKKGGDPEVLDAALIGGAQKVEHYEIASYGTLRTWCMRLGRAEAASLLQQTLEEEGNTDHKLTRIAESHVNQEAASQTAGWRRAA